MGVNSGRLKPAAALLIAAMLDAGCGFTHAPRGAPELWRQPQSIESYDFTYGRNGREFTPQAPFRFVREDLRGTSPKVFVTDAANRTWRVKGGLEVRSESFCTRLASAVGYYAEPTYFLASGDIAGVGRLGRASGFISKSGHFLWASFQRFEPDMKLLPEESWTWSGNPFDGSPQLNGLKILVMLVSDWDNKDASNELRGSNLGIVERYTPAGNVWIYFVNDWGQSLGKWGETYSETSTFDCAGFTRQSREFMQGVRNGMVAFGYRGQHTKDFDSGVRASDVVWLMQWLGRVSDDQLRAGLQASGANENETACLSAALRDRIEQLRTVR